MRGGGEGKRRQGDRNRGLGGGLAELDGELGQPLRGAGFDIDALSGKPAAELAGAQARIDIFPFQNGDNGGGPGGGGPFQIAGPIAEQAGMEADTAGGKTLLEVRVQPGGEVQRCEPAHQIRSPQRCVWGCLQKPQRLGQLHRFIPNPFPILISMIDPLARRVIPLSNI